MRKPFTVVISTETVSEGEIVDYLTKCLSDRFGTAVFIQKVYPFRQKGVSQ